MTESVSAGNSDPFLRGSNAVTVGMFDGVHRGHALLIQKLREEAARIGGRAIVVTLDRHPAEVVSPHHAPPYITTLERKVELLKEAGADEVVVIPFGEEVASLSPEDFAKDFLKGKLNAGAVVAGPNFRFGAGRKGDTDMLRALGDELGFYVTVVPRLHLLGAGVSSTRIRVSIQRGNVKEASELLGRPFELPGTVVTGAQIGRTIGFPTANIQPIPKIVRPAEGVYATRVILNNGTFPSAVSIGKRVTLNEGEVVIEAYLLDYSGDLYDQQMSLQFIDRLRDQRRFESKEELVVQIEKDVAAVRSLT